MAWYSIDMPEVSVNDGVYHRLCREFQKAFIGASAPPELAMFACRDAHPEQRRLYLSPSASSYVPDLIHEYGAEACGVPDAASVTLVYGVPGAKSLLSVSDTSLSAQGDTSAVYPLVPARHTASSG